MIDEFNEGLMSDHRDALDAPDQDFDWQRLYERLDEDAGAGRNEGEQAETVRQLLQILVSEADQQIRLRSLGLRLIALAWVLNPSYFEGSPSLRELARRASVTPAKLARHTGRFSRLLRWRNRGQRHAWNWRKGQRS